jgi:predicted dehydrogenase
MQPLFDETANPMESGNASALVPLAPIRLGIVGCSGSRQNYGPALPYVPDIQVTALMDVDMVAARVWARALRHTAVFTDYEVFLQEAPVDAVLISSPLPVRVEQVIAAAKAGKHILCEKPMARTLEECERMTEAAGESGVLLLPAYVKRFDRTFLYAQQCLQEGTLGELQQIRCDWSFYAGWGDRREILKRWAGVFEEHAHHTIDLCRWWMGEVESVSADIDIGRSPDGKTDQFANLILTHTRGVSIHHIARVFHKRPVEQYLLTGTQGTLHITHGVEWNQVVSEPFSVTLHLQGLPAQEIPQTEYTRIEEEIRAHHPGKRLLAHFADCIRSGQTPQISGEDGCRVVEILNAGYLSTYEHAKITLPLTRSMVLEQILQKVAENWQSATVR